MRTGAVKRGRTVAYGAATWSPRVADRDDLVATWGDEGVSSACGTLRTVLLRRPGPERGRSVGLRRMQVRSRATSTTPARGKMIATSW